MIHPIKAFLDKEFPQNQPFGAGKEQGQQGSVEWLYERVGMITASRFKDAIYTLGNGKSSAKRDAYKWEIVIERLTGQPCQHFESTAMQHGTEKEPLARMAYCAATGAFVDEVGFIRKDDVFGGSPDGLIGKDGGIEIKCPFNTANHLACFLNGVPEEHLPQIHGLMWITWREWWDFVSYDDRLPAPYNLFIKRVVRDEDYLNFMCEGLQVFSDETKALSDAIAKAALSEEPAL